MLKYCGAALAISLCDILDMANLIRDCTEDFFKSVKAANLGPLVHLEDFHEDDLPGPINDFNDIIDIVHDDESDISSEDDIETDDFLFTDHDENFSVIQFDGGHYAASTPFFPNIAMPDYIRAVEDIAYAEGFPYHNNEIIQFNSNEEDCEYSANCLLSKFTPA